MTTLADQLNDATLARLAQVRRGTLRPPAHADRFRVSRVAGRVVVVREGGGLVLDVTAAAARQLARQIATTAEGSG